MYVMSDRWMELLRRSLGRREGGMNESLLLVFFFFSLSKTCMRNRGTGKV